MINRNTEFELLHVLVAAAESKNFYEAARKLGISQPAVSTKLKRLDEQSPLPVFSLRGKKKVLTRYGQELYDMAKLQIEANKMGIERLNRKFVEANELVLRVGCRSDIFEAMAPRLFFEGRVEHHPLSSHAAAQALRNQEIDLAFSSERPDLPDVFSKTVLTSAAQFAVHSKWLKRERLSLPLVSNPKFLARIPCFLYQADGHLLKDWVNSQGIPFSALNVAAVVQDWRTIQNLVDQGLGFGVVPSYVVSHSERVQRMPLPKEALAPIAFHASYRKDLKRIPAFGRILSRL